MSNNDILLTENQVFRNSVIDTLYCGKSFNTTNSGGIIKNVHRCSDEELALYGPFSTYAQIYIESHINKWQQKGKYEKTTDWQKRVNRTSRKAKVEELYKEAQKNYLEHYGTR